MSRIQTLIEKIKKIKNKEGLEKLKRNIENSTTNFKSDRDISTYFGDYKLYLKYVITEKYKNHQLSLSSTDFMRLIRKIYLGEEESINWVLKLLNEEELKTYNILFENYSSSLENKWINSLSNSEKYALRNYAEKFGSIDSQEAMEMFNYETKDSYVTLQTLMRNGLVGGDPRIDSAISKFGCLPNPILVYRKIGIDGLYDQLGNLNNNNLSSLIGKTYTDKSYMSASLLENSAIPHMKTETGVLLKITVPNDEIYGAYIESQSNLNYRQREFLIDKNSVSIIKNAYIEEGTIVLEMTLLNREQKMNLNNKKEVKTL